MERISSDTNVWLDFATIDRLELPFRLPFVYLMSKSAIEDELLNPPELGKKLAEYGLRKADLTEKEFYLADEYISKYIRLSSYDAIALAVAKAREITLLTGDAALRKAAVKEDVATMGTIGVLDQLYNGGYISEDEFHHCIGRLIKHNGGKIRLPIAELEKRLEIH